MLFNLPDDAALTLQYGASPTVPRAELVRTRPAVDAAEGFRRGRRAAGRGSDGMGSGLDLDCFVAAGGADQFLIDHPVRATIQLLTAMAAKTTVRCASMESRR